MRSTTPVSRPAASSTGRRSKPAWWIAFSFTTAPRFWAAWKRSPSPAASDGAAAPTPFASTTSPSIPFHPTNSPSKDTLMFTGIIEELGTVVATRDTTGATAGSRLSIRCSTVLSDAALGASIAVNGVCLTVTGLRPDGFSADLAPEALERTSEERRAGKQCRSWCQWSEDVCSSDLCPPRRQYRRQRRLSHRHRTAPRWVPRRPRPGDARAQQPGRSAPRLARQPGTPTLPQRPDERPHRAGPRRWHRRIPLPGWTRRRQLVAAHSHP